MDTVQIMPAHVIMLLPFPLLLLSIATIPLVNSHFWERRYPLISLGLGAVAVFYYIFILENGPRMILTGIEYFSFICLIGSLFVVSGGIHINIKGRSTPLANVVILMIGAIISNLLGTTGASMVLIRPFIRMNKYRISGYHIVFFIFIVSNIGGLLTPIGDPPLFLGYLKGVPFFWITSRTIHIWAIVNILVLFVFYVIDRRNFNKLPQMMEQEIEEEGEQARVSGLVNLVFIAVILVSVFLSTPLRELIMITASVASYVTTRREVHEQNHFTFTPIKEVAILFAGIFATMVPVLDWLQLNAGLLGMTKPGQFYWASGILSSFLDNAPTYLTFLSTACGLHGLSVDNIQNIHALLGLIPAESLSHLQTLVSNPVSHLDSNSWKYVQAISVGAVLFGANTYIGNGPNFMVKSIAEHAQVKVPSFFGYMIKYSIPVLVPIFTIMWVLFFR
jgi:Na+/H+ antiporter NhaD/arsenite permease-like protein